MKHNYFLASALGLSLALNAYAEPNFPAVEQVCVTASGEYQVDRIKLLYWAIDQANMDSLCLIDPESNSLYDPASLIEYLNKTYTDESPPPSPLCASNKAAAAFTDAVLKMTELLEDFANTGDAAPSKAQPFQAKDIKAEAADISGFGLYALNPGTTRILCYQGDDTTSDSPKPKAGSQVTHTYLFRESLEEFAKKAYSDAKGGRVAYESLTDGDDKTTNSSKFVLGVRLGKKTASAPRFLGSFNSITPYLSFDASKVATTSDGDRSTDKKEERGIGVSGKTSIAGEQWNHSIDSSLSYLDERYDDTQIGQLSVLYTPDSSGLVNDWVAFPLVYIFPKWNLQAKYADIFDEGNVSGDELETLQDNKRYSAFGSSVGVTLRSHNIKYDKTELLLEYSYFVLSDHEENNTDLKKIGLTHFIDPSKRYGIEFSYSKGEDGVLLDKIDKWIVALSARY